MRNCQLCEQEVAQRWEIQANTYSPLQQGNPTKYHNAAAKHIIQSRILDKICSKEPAITGMATDTRTRYEEYTRKVIQKTLTDETKALVCYKCAQPAMLEAYRRHGNQNDSDKTNQLRDYRAIFKNAPTGLCPEDVNKTRQGNSGTSTVDPWQRETRRGRYVYNKTKETLGTVITIAPSRQQFSEGNYDAQIVAFVRHCGNIKNRAQATTAPPTIDDTTLCHEISLQELEEQHTDYNVSAACKRWRREARLPKFSRTTDRGQETTTTRNIQTTGIRGGHQPGNRGTRNPEL